MSKSALVSVILILLLIGVSSALDISSCRSLNTASTSYSLTADVSSAGTCFTIAANNIILDCQGHKINYSQSIKGYAVNNSATYGSTTIRNCVIVQGSNLDDSYGIYLRGDDCLVENNTITTFGKSSHGIFQPSGAESNIIIGNRIRTSGAYNAVGIYSNYLSDAHLTDNDITTSGDVGYGVYVYHSTKASIIENNRIKTSGPDHAYGIALDYPVNLTVRGNIVTASGFAGYGITISQTDKPNWVTDNRISCSGANGHGIYLGSNAHNIDVSDNSVSTTGTFGQGIYLDSSLDNSITTNSITTSNSNSRGIYVLSSSENKIAQNSVTTSGANGHGIEIIYSSDNNTVANNTIKSKLSYAVYFRSDTTNKPENNRIYNNLIKGSSPVGFSSSSAANTWNTAKQAGSRTYSAGTMIGGNYYTTSSGLGYSDTCSDADRDGFCDLAYALASGNVDTLPLSDEYSTATTTTSASTSTTTAPTITTTTNIIADTTTTTMAPSSSTSSSSTSTSMPNTSTTSSTTSIPVDGTYTTTLPAGGSGGGSEDGGGGTNSGQPKISCFDGIKNQGETGVDCGGSCSPCMSCSDGIQNQGETGIDCGGSCKPCSSCNDGILSAGEIEVDCGGPCRSCPRIRTNGTYYVNENLSVTVDHAWAGLALTIKEPGEEPVTYGIASVDVDQRYTLAYVPRKEGMLLLKVSGDERYVKIKSRQLIPLLEEVPPEVRSLFIPLLLATAAVWFARRRTKVVVDEQILEGFEQYTMDYMDMIEKYRRFYTAAEKEDKYANLTSIAFMELSAADLTQAEAITTKYGVVPSIGRALFLCRKLRAKTYLTTADLPEEIHENFQGTKIMRP